MTITVQTLVDGFLEAVRSSAENIEHVHGKHWDARLDVARTVVSIAAPIFAGTVIFLDKISPHASVVQIVALFASWASLVVSIIAGLIVLLKTVTLHSFHPKAFNGQVFVHAKFSALNLTSPDVVDKAAEITRHATTELFNAIGKADQQATSAAATCLAAFGMSMLCFLIYALVRVCGGE